MNVTVTGLWHLGSVTAACIAQHHPVIAHDPDLAVVDRLSHGHAPVHEPGLDELIAGRLASGQLRFTHDPATAADTDLLWLCHDTPVDDNDQPDVEWVLARAKPLFQAVRPGTTVLISAQLPVGTCARLATDHPDLIFACSPENLRLGRALESFNRPDRIVVGAPPAARPALEQLFHPIGAPLIWMRPASAEMVKHALNSFLALSVAYANEVAVLGERYGVDATEVAAGLKSDPRVGSRAYLSPGGAFAGGTLARDVVTLTQLAEASGVALSLIPAIKPSNDHHRTWALRTVCTELADSPQPIVSVLGLTYTPNTNTLRRSASVELCRALSAAGARVRAYDPIITTTGPAHADLSIAPSAAASTQGADAVIICTEWPEFRDYDWSTILSGMRRKLIVDPGRFVEKSVAAQPGVVYRCVGQS